MAMTLTDAFGWLKTPRRAGLRWVHEDHALEEGTWGYVQEGTRLFVCWRCRWGTSHGQYFDSMPHWVRCSCCPEGYTLTPPERDLRAELMAAEVETFAHDAWSESFSTITWPPMGENGPGIAAKQYPHPEDDPLVRIARNLRRVRVANRRSKW